MWLTPAGPAEFSSTTDSTGTRVATIWAINPPMEWPTSTGGRSKRCFSM